MCVTEIRNLCVGTAITHITKIFSDKNACLSEKIRIFAAIMNKELNISYIKNGFPGLSEVLSNMCYEACMVCLRRNGHSDGVSMQLKGLMEKRIPLRLFDYFDDRVERSWQDTGDAAEYGAICISSLLLIECIDYTIIERSRKGTGFDYWLGYDNDLLFQNAARLEVSGIFKETENNTAEKRFQMKMKQTDKSDNYNIPAYISVVEFSNPKTIFDKKQ